LDQPSKIGHKKCIYFQYRKHCLMLSQWATV
jgi:hypothetical protein